MIVSFVCELIHSSIPSFPLTTYPALRITGVLDIPADLTERQGHTLGESPVYCREIAKSISLNVHVFGLWIETHTDRKNTKTPKCQLIVFAVS